MPASTSSSPSRPARKEILNYSAPWPVYGLDWSNQRTEAGAMRLAVGSFIEDGSNKIQIITLPEFADHAGEHFNTMSDWVPIAEATHQYPVTKIKWEPYSNNQRAHDLLATSGDYLRLWELRDEPTHGPGSNTIGRQAPTRHSQQLYQRGALANTKANFCAPLTSFDWNTIDPALIVTSSIDTTCTVWNVETQQAMTQLIAHDKEVYDVSFATNNSDIFASVGADGSVRMFDLRALEHSTIIYETSSNLSAALSPNNPSHSAGSGSGPGPAGPGVGGGGGGGGGADTTGAAGAGTGAGAGAGAAGVAGAAGGVQQPLPTVPLLRLAFNRLDAHYLATFHADSSKVQILDIRMPGMPSSELHGHKGIVNCMAWSPTSRSAICTGSDDHQVFIWEINSLRQSRHEGDHHRLQESAEGGGVGGGGSGAGHNGSHKASLSTSSTSSSSHHHHHHHSNSNQTKTVPEPFRAANVGGEVNQICWSSASPDWVAVGFGRTIQALRL
ncbi:ddb1 and cul4 associated factor 7 [Actinomortierella ambigua]|nr:ddb1 and cul4 associated factor 7 [Actinomortierella ambigua]